MANAEVRSSRVRHLADRRNASVLSLPELLRDWVEQLRAKRMQSVELYERAAIGKREPRRMREGDPILARLEERRDRFEFAHETLRTDASFYLVMNRTTSRFARPNARSTHSMSTISTSAESSSTE